jgi:hypothetical protein
MYHQVQLKASADRERIIINLWVNTHSVVPLLNINMRYELTIIYLFLFFYKLCLII